MIDVVFPKNNEIEFIEMAKKLGLDGLCFVYGGKKDISKLDKSTKLKIFSTSSFAKASDPNSNRALIESRRADMVYALEDHERIDSMHFRDSGLNHVLCKLAVDKEVMMGFSFNSVLKAGRRKRAVILGRMQQNARFSRKFGFKPVVASFAASPFEMRAEKEMTAFASCIGFGPGEAKQAVSNLEKYFNEKEEG